MPSSTRPGDLLWEPAPDAFTDSALARFALSHGFDPHDYARLHEWSVRERGEFWSAVWDAAGIIGDKNVAVPADAEVLPDRPDPSGHDHMFGTRYFPDARLSFAENLLRGDDGRLAVVTVDEDGTTRRYTMGELRGLVAGAQRGLERLGVGEGTVVAGVLPNRIENLIGYLATLSLGAIWAGCSPDFGAPGLIDRLGQVAPHVVLAVDSYTYNGRRHDIRANVRALLDALPVRPHLVVAGSADWDAQFGDTDAELALPRFGFDHPGFYLFTSGTTGLPKCIVHSTGGVLLQHVKEHLLHGDVRPGDVHSWYTSTAWMMYGWVVSVLAAQATVVLLDGAPSPRGADGRPDHAHLWRAAGAAGVTHFGTSPRYLQSLADAGYHPAEHHDLRALRSVLSAGAPVSAEQFGWVYDHVKRDQCFASIAGGTEIHGCFQLGSPLHPVHAGEITCIALGHAVAVFDEHGTPVVGRSGDLVCTEPFPSMPLTFGGDRGRERFHAAYFEKHPGVWTHGDFAEITPRASVVVSGRSDSTLNPSGVRIGTAEIYRVIERRPEFTDAIVFGHALPVRAAGSAGTVSGDEEVVVCVVPADGVELTDRLRAELVRDIRTQASPRHVPAHVFAVPAIPYTINGKRVESAVKALCEGRPVTNRGSLVDPTALDAFEHLFASPVGAL